MAGFALVLASTALPNGAVGTAVYGYDPDGRLVTAHYDNGMCVAYSYDENGNRTSQSNTVASAEESPTGLGD